MRIEWLSQHQFELFLTFDDLNERGFTKEDIWLDIDKVKRLFSDMMFEASDELGFELYGSILVQVHLKQAQGMHVVVTQKTADNVLDEDIFEMKVTLEESNELLFLFKEFEDIIKVASPLSRLLINSGQVYFMNGLYYMLFENDDLGDNNKDDVIAVMTEFGSASIMTSHRIKEYGKPIFKSNAVDNLVYYFN